MCKNSERKCALRAKSPVFVAIMNHSVATSDRHVDSSTGAKDLDACAPTLDQMAHHNKNAGSSEKRTDNTFMRSDSLVNTYCRKKLRSLIQPKVISTTSATQREKLRSVSHNMVKKFIGSVSTKSCFTATKSQKNVSFSFEENSIAEMTVNDVLDENLSQSFNCWPQLDCKRLSCLILA